MRGKRMRQRLSCVAASVCAALALSFAVQDRWLRLFFLAAASILTFCLVLTFSRGAWYGLAAALVAVFAVFAVGRWRQPPAK